MAFPACTTTLAASGIGRLMGVIAVNTHGCDDDALRNISRAMVVSFCVWTVEIVPVPIRSDIIGGVEGSLGRDWWCVVRRDLGHEVGTRGQTRPIMVMAIDLLSWLVVAVLLSLLLMPWPLYRQTVWGGMFQAWHSFSS